MDSENLHLLKQRSVLIYLIALPETLLRRLRSENQRPLLKADDRLVRIEDLLAQREKVYRQAHISIDTEHLSVDEVVERIIKAISRRSAKVV